MVKPFVFIIGAGASTELGDKDAFPVGTELAERIGRELRAAINQAQKSHGYSANKIIQALRARGGLTPELLGDADKVCSALIGHASIDDLLNDWVDRPGMSRVAKITIAHCILQSELRSPLARARLDSTESIQAALTSLQGSWLAILLRRFKPEVSPRKIVEALRHVAFITFNYDRTIEKLLFHWIMSVTDLDAAQAEKAVQAIEIIHPHGCLGQLNFQRYTSDGYGSEDVDLNEASSLIRTYSEENSRDEELARIEELCDNAKQLIFLGFSYHKHNMEILFPRSMEPNGEVWGTAYKLSRKQLSEAGEFLLPRHGEAVSERLVPQKCAQLIDSIVDDLS